MIGRVGRGVAVTGARVPDRRASAWARSIRRSWALGSRAKAAGVTPTTTTRAADRSEPCCDGDVPVEAVGVELTGVHHHRHSNVVEPHVGRGQHFACGPGEQEDLPSGKEGWARYGPVRADRTRAPTRRRPPLARTCRSRTVPERPRASTQCSRSSSRTRRRCTASMTSARACRSSGVSAAASTTARARQPTRSPSRSRMGSPVSVVLRMSTHAIRRDLRGAGTSTRTGGPTEHDVSPCKAPAVMLASQAPSPPDSKAATSRWCCVGRPVCKA